MNNIGHKIYDIQGLTAEKQKGFLEHVKILDTLEAQLKELAIIRNPHLPKQAIDYPQEISKILGSTPIEQYGNWIYYPWSNTLLRLLPEEEFIEVRTNRNKLKITGEEQNLLRSKRVVVIGLSVGHAIATTLVLERLCGEIIIVDFDEIELSNLNRIKTSLTNLGKNKAISTAEAIAEIDPYIKIVTSLDALNKNNIEELVFSKNPDLIIEVCDSLDVKVLVRDFAKRYHVPVIMETNDKCMIDIERFDLEPSRPMFHGIAGELSASSLAGLTTEEKVPYILRIVGADNISSRLRSSMLEIDQSITSWPQLGSNVIMGAGITADISRKVLLKQNNISGRFYADTDSIIGANDNSSSSALAQESRSLSTAQTPPEVVDYIKKYIKEHTSEYDLTIEQVVEYARKSPSAGNNQPWLIVKYYNHLLVCHREHISNTWGDFSKMGALMSMGGLIEIIKCNATALGLNADIDFNFDKALPLAHITFSKLADATIKLDAEAKVERLNKRHTDRVSNSSQPIDSQLINRVILECSVITPVVINDMQRLAKIANWSGECDKIRLFNPEGHKEFFNELRWSEKDLLSSRDGISVEDAGLSEAEKAGFYMAKDYASVELIKQLNLGNGFKRISKKHLSEASAIVIYTIKSFDRASLIKAGGEIVQQWAHFNSNNISVYPMLSVIFMLNRFRQNAKDGLTDADLKVLGDISNEFYNLLNISVGNYPVFLMKLSHKTHQTKESIRKKLDEIYIRYA